MGANMHCWVEVILFPSPSEGGGQSWRPVAEFHVPRDYVLFQLLHGPSRRHHEYVHPMVPDNICTRGFSVEVQQEIEKSDVWMKAVNVLNADECRTILCKMAGFRLYPLHSRSYFEAALVACTIVGGRLIYWFED